MELQDYLRSVWRRLPWIAIVAAAVVVVGMLGEAPAERFRAASQVVFSFEKPTGSIDGSVLVDYETAQLATLAEVAVSTDLLDSIIADLGLEKTGPELAEDITVRLLPGTFIIEVSASADSADTAEGISQKVAAAIVDQAPNLLPQIAVSGTQLTVDPVMSTAVVTSTLKDLVKFAVIGVVLALGLSVLADTFDPRVRTRRDLRRVSSTVVTAESHGSEDAAALAARVAVQCPTPGSRTIVVVPSRRGTAHEQLANDLAEGYGAMSESTVLVTRDGTTAPGGAVVVQRVSETMPSADPADLAQQLATLQSSFATVIIALPLAESSQLTLPLVDLADACLVVAEEGRVERTRVADTLSIIREAGPRLLVAVLVPRARRSR